MLEYTYSISVEKIRKAGYVAKVVQISNSTGSETIFSGIVSATPQGAIIKSAKWLVDYAEIQLMSGEQEEYPY